MNHKTLKQIKTPILPHKCFQILMIVKYTKCQIKLCLTLHYREDQVSENPNLCPIDFNFSRKEY